MGLAPIFMKDKFMISPHIKAALQSRYPRADFSEYFDFLEGIPERKSTARIIYNVENHHILPASVKTFYPYRTDPDNLIALSPEDHDKAHLFLGAAEPWLLRTARRARGYYLVENKGEEKT